MNKNLVLIFLFATFSVSSYAQQIDSFGTPQSNERQHVYNIRPWVDIPVSVVFAGLTLHGFSVIYGRDDIPVAEIMALNKNNINKFDRGATNNYSVEAKKTSDLFFYGSMPLPLALLLDKEIRKDGPRVGLLYLEAMTITGIFYTTSAMIADRIRPYSYNPNAPMDTRKSGGSRNSFIGGHPALVATATFFMAKVYSDYHPGMRGKWILFASAGALTAVTAYLRLKAGQHFPTDLIAGVTIGSLVGILAPHIHKNKKMTSQRLTLLPNYQNGNTGFTAFYKLNK
ncbi:MAG TPA: phosphatase PAP2 family protein [Ferruginibacter sp.]|nr:phosphatase PAP2 family protein [Ferruginibacter sp.]